MQAKITKRTVDTTTAVDADIWIWDTEVKGFGLRVRPNGHKTYLVEYRPGGGGRAAPKRRLTIGKHGSPWTPDSARVEAKRVLGAVADGDDPVAEKAAGKKGETMADLADQFMTEYVVTKCKPRTADGYRDLVNRFITPNLGKLKVKAVTRTDIARLHHSMRSTPRQANHVLAVLSKMVTLAEVWGQRPDGSNPCRHVEKNAEVRRERFLTAEELECLGAALASFSGSPYTSALFKLLIFTGARLSEIQALRWEWVDLERGEVRLPDSKTGAKTVHLPPPALTVLGGLARLEKNPYVICGEKTGGHMIGVQKQWQRIRKTATVKLWLNGGHTADLLAPLVAKLDREPTFEECEAFAALAKVSLPVGLENVRIHDLRHAFASVAVSSGMGLPIIGKVLGHSQAATTARYAHLAADPVKAAAATVAGKIEAAMGTIEGNPGKIKGEVIQLSKRKP